MTNANKSSIIYNTVISYMIVMELEKSAGISVSDHLAKVSKMINLGKGAKRQVEDYMLT